MEITVGLVSLGCSKNRVDSEQMLGRLSEKGYRIVDDPAKAEVIIVNTCGFIQSAKEEAIATIFEMAEYKETGRCKLLVAVTISGLILMGAAALIVYFFRKNWRRWGGGYDDDED